MKKIHFAAVVACVAVAASACATPVEKVSAPVRTDVESYGLCVVGTSYPCVVTDGGAYFVATAEYSGYGMPACLAEDGPAPCVWDSANRGDGTAGVGVKRYVIVR